MERGISARLTPAEGRKFGLVVGGAFLAIGALLWWRTHVTAASAAGALGAALVLGGLLIPGRLGPVYRGWMKLALLISKVTTPLFMGIIFLLVLTPAGLLARLVGHRPLSRGREAPTFWLSRSAGAARSGMDHQF